MHVTLLVLDLSKAGEAPSVLQRLQKKARAAELDLIEAIERSKDNEGNIGKIAKRLLKRLPSSVYWQDWPYGVFAPTPAPNLNITEASIAITNS